MSHITVDLSKTWTLVRACPDCGPPGPQLRYDTSPRPACTICRGTKQVIAVFESTDALRAYVAGL